LRLKKLAPLLDIDRFISFAAVEVIVGHHDGYSMDRNNYRIYHDPGSGQMVFLPHGLDQLFDKIDSPLVPEWRGLIAKAVLTTPTGAQQYLERLSKLLPKAFKAETLQARIQELAAIIRAALAERDAKDAKAFDSALAQFQDHIAKRATFLERQLKSQNGSK
jgi:spore coat protein CotH